MKVNIKTYTDRTGYETNAATNGEVQKGSIGEALKYCKAQIKGAEGFIGFRIESTKGELKHKLHNQ